MPRRKKPTRNELVAKEALEWVGTKFHPQASVKQVGCDCKGLVWGVARELGFPEAESFYATFIDYDLQRRDGVPGSLLREGMAELFDRGDEARPGDVLLLSVKQPCHLAIVSRELNGHLRAVHAQISSRAWVKETRLDAFLTKYRLDSIWRWRNG
jgi:cell wall-associated NlpC family hydrolase